MDEAIAKLAVPSTHLSSVESSPITSGDAASQQADLILGSLWVHFADRNLCNNSILAERAAAHKMEELLPLASEAAGAIGHHTLTLGCSDAGTEVGLGVLAKLAVTTLRNVQRNHAVTYRDDTMELIG